MIVVANRIPVAAGYEADFEERFRRRLGLIDHEDGFIRNVVLRPVQGDCYVVMTFWRDQAAFEAWTHSESFAKAHGGERPPREMFRGPNSLEIHEVIQLSEAPAEP
jgi:heme-degrading monooxygenase HmoA